MCYFIGVERKMERGLLVKRQLPFFVALTVLVCASANACSARREQEATLKQELRSMRQAIDAYTLEKQRAPQEDAPRLVET